jgi:hypothetical protein
MLAKCRYLCAGIDFGKQMSPRALLAEPTMEDTKRLIPRLILFGS